MKRVYEMPLRWFVNLPIGMKYLTVTSTLVLLSLMLFGYTTNRTYTDIILDGSIRQNTMYLSMVGRSLESGFTDVENLANTIVVNDRIQENLLDYSALDENRRFDVEKKIGFYLDDMVNQKELLDSAAIYIDDRLAIVSEGEALLPEVTAHIAPSMNPAYDRSGDWSYVLIQGQSEEDNTMVMLHSKNIYHGERGRFMGKLVLVIREPAINRYYSGALLEEGASFFVISPNDTIVSSNIPAKIGATMTFDGERELLDSTVVLGTAITSYRDEGALVTASQIANKAWRLVGSLPMSAVTSESNSVTRSVLYIGIVFYGLLLVALIFFGQRITRPIVHLTEVVTGLDQRNPDFEFAYESKDEIGKLGESFKDLTIRTHELMEQIVAEQKSKQINEFLALQAQINPHFLYNTLESACSLIRMKDDDNAFKLVKSLGVFYRTSLSKGKSVISLEGEIQNVSSYLTIQRIRYGEKVTYKVDVPEDLWAQSIIKLSLQPLIENAIYHGIRKRPGRGHIEVLAKRQGTYLEISVTDDGVGMDDAMLSQLMDGHNSESWRASYGLRSVHERIQLHFGQAYGMEVTSKKDVGTTVRLRLPFKDKGEVIQDV